jgi:predicted HicB family RNase H-like nuclease
MTYKGYEGVARFDEEAGVFAGEVINTRDVITFQGPSVKELKRAFEESIDDYLDFCAARKEEPEKPFSGSFVVRLPPKLHRHVALEAKRKGKSLNAYVIERLKPRAKETGVRA